MMLGIVFLDAAFAGWVDMHCVYFCHDKICCSAVVAIVGLSIRMEWEG